MQYVAAITAIFDMLNSICTFLGIDIDIDAAYIVDYTQLIYECLTDGYTDIDGNLVTIFGQVSYIEEWTRRTLDLCSTYFPYLSYLYGIFNMFEYEYPNTYIADLFSSLSDLYNLINDRPVYSYSSILSQIYAALTYLDGATTVDSVLDNATSVEYLLSYLFGDIAGDTLAAYAEETFNDFFLYAGLFFFPFILDLLAVEPVSPFGNIGGWLNFGNGIKGDFTLGSEYANSYLFADDGFVMTIFHICVCLGYIGMLASFSMHLFIPKVSES